MRDDINSQYTITSLMAADIFTKGFTDARKLALLCEQINIAPLNRFDTVDLQQVHHVFKNDTANRSKKVRDDGLARVPPGCERWCAKVGWHEEGDIRYAVVEEPKYH